MRRLYAVPIIHMSADMGSAAPALEETSAEKLTPELWQRHKEIVSTFWDAIGGFFETLEVNGFKVYQDGLAADGEEGLKIVREGAGQGSKNYKIVGRLIDRGAVLMKTESLPLVKQEYHFITKITLAKSAKEKEVAALRYKLAQGRLLKQRDEFIAGTINETLAEGETGILFTGAYHDVVKRLAPDIRAVQVKEVDRVRAYHKLLINTKAHDRQIQDLSEYLASPISIPPILGNQ